MTNRVPVVFYPIGNWDFVTSYLRTLLCHLMFWPILLTKKSHAESNLRVSRRQHRRLPKERLNKKLADVSNSLLSPLFQTELVIPKPVNSGKYGNGTTGNVKLILVHYQHLWLGYSPPLLFNFRIPEIGGLYRWRLCIRAVCVEAKSKNVTSA